MAALENINVSIVPPTGIFSAQPATRRKRLNVVFFFLKVTNSKIFKILLIVCLMQDRH